MNFKESIKYDFLSIIVTIIHSIRILFMNPLKWFYVLITNKSKESEDTFKEYYYGKTVVVTGGSSGIGLEIAKLLSSFGANIIISSRNKEKLIEVAALCRIINPKISVFPIELDLEKYQNIDDYTTQIIDTLEKKGLSPKIDVLINSAGVSSRGLAMDTSMETLERVMNINFLGPAALTRSIAANMISHGGGAIGVVSSVQGKFGIPYRTSYAASKHALQGYFDGLRAELSVQNITVTSISPGYVNTSLSMNALNADGTRYSKNDATTASGMDPAELGMKILLSIMKGEADIIIADAKTSMGVLLKVLMPEMFASMMKQRIEKY